MKNNIVLVLKLRGWTQRRLVEELHKNGMKKLDYAYMNRIVSGKVRPSFNLTFAIAFILNCKVDELFMPSEEELFSGNDNANHDS